MFNRGKSLPARGVWIEILPTLEHAASLCRSPQGECGLKSLVDGFNELAKEVAPRKGSVD